MSVFGRGRHHKKPGQRTVRELAAAGADLPAEPLTSGPFDEADAPDDDVFRLDLGSLRIAWPAGVSLQPVFDGAGVLQSVIMQTPIGRIRISAFAAPRKAKLWREECGKIVDQMRAEGSEVREVDGEWGREVHVVGTAATGRFVGVDGPRWLLRGDAVGPADTHDRLVTALHDVLRASVVVRGSGPLPARSPLPLTLPEGLVPAAQEAGQQQDSGPV